MPVPPGICERCLQPFDQHCWLHEPVILCPVKNNAGVLVSPCKAAGPKGT